LFATANDGEFWKTCMKTLAILTTAIGLLLAGSAGAADIRMPVKAPPPAPVAVYNWTGCYVGAGGGYGMFDQRQRLTNPPQSQAWDNGGIGWFATVQVGCDYQVASSIIVGAFADYDWSGIKGHITDANLQPYIADGKLKSSWAVGGRIGWIPWQQAQFLIFVSGGYAEARFGQADFRHIRSGLPLGQSLPRHTYAGWFLGAGYEYGLGWLPGLFWKTEYRFTGYGAENFPVVFTANGLPTGATIESRMYVQTIRSELVWRFNAGGPVVAPVVDVRHPLPVKAPVPAPLAVYNWTGCYLGGGGGYGMLHQRNAYLAPAPFGTHADSGGRGWFGTVQAGCDYQVASSVVIGAFADYDWSGIKGKMNSTVLGAIADEKLKSVWAAGGRIGWIPWQQTPIMAFVSGGYTEARFDQADFYDVIIPTPFGSSLARHTYSGWFLGAGYEYGLGWLPGLFWKTEYRFADYGTENVALITTANGLPQADSFNMRKYIQTIRSELVWRFNLGGPVVARY
jgi:hypothetical protein